MPGASSGTVPNQTLPNNENVLPEDMSGFLYQLSHSHEILPLRPTLKPTTDDMPDLSPFKKELKGISLIGSRRVTPPSSGLKSAIRTKSSPRPTYTSCVAEFNKPNPPFNKNPPPL
jgi:hypothetical protein